MHFPAHRVVRGLPALVGHRKGGLRHFFANLIHHGVNLAPHRQIVGGPRRQAAQMGKNNSGNVVDSLVKIVVAASRSWLRRGRRQPPCAAIAAARAANISDRQRGSGRARSRRLVASAFGGIGPCPDVPLASAVANDPQQTFRCLHGSAKVRCRRSVSMPMLGAVPTSALGN